MWSVFASREPLGEDRDKAGGRGRGTARRRRRRRASWCGALRRRGLRADADLMVWWHAETVESCSPPTTGSVAPSSGRACEPVWSVVALHRPAEFNKSHVPAFLAGEEPRAYVCVYPFVRSYEWYLLDDAERRDMLVEHGQMARDYPDVRANTVASFALGDYEWILAFEADELHRIVDLMRDLRAHQARRHVREEVPFYTGTGCRSTTSSRPALTAVERSCSPVEPLRRVGRHRLGLQAEADRVDAVPLVGRGVVALALEDVAQVRAAVLAAHLGPDACRRCGPRCTRRGPRRAARRTTATRSASRTWCRCGTARPRRRGTSRRPRSSCRCTRRRTAARCPPRAARGTRTATAPLASPRRSSPRGMRRPPGRSTEGSSC